MFLFTPLLGACSSSPASQSLLEFEGGIQVLVDVGWDESFSVERLRALERHVPTLSFILLTHATTAHLGAYAHCCKNLPLFARVPVYATNPVISLGRTLLQDLYASTPLARSIIPAHAFHHPAPSLLLQPPSAEEITHYFARINPLRYSQPHQPLPSPHSPPLNGLTITAYSAGHTLGGSLWHIQHGMESVVYAVDWNQAREHVLSGAAWLGRPSTRGSEVLEQLRRPTALICSSRGTGLTRVARPPSKRDDILLAMIRDTVAAGGTVLIPSDSSARILELAYLLERAWQRETYEPESTSPLKRVRIYLASRTAGATMRHVRSMLEWMEEGIVKEFEAASGAADQDRRNRSGKDDEKGARIPFDFRHITLLEQKSHVTRMLAAVEPRVILASDALLEWGFSKDAMEKLASDSKNLVVLTERAGELDAQSEGLGSALWNLWKQQTESTADTPSVAIVQGSGQPLSIRNVQIAPLEGDEVPMYQQFLASQRQRQTTMGGDAGVALEPSMDVVDDPSSDESESSEESEDGYRGKALNATAALQHARNKLDMTDAELGVGVLLRRKHVHDYHVQGKKGKERMFPFQSKKKRGDDFGELVRLEEFARVGEEDNVAGKLLGGENTKEGNAVGQKRRWNDLVHATHSSNTKASEKWQREGGEDGTNYDSEPEESLDKVDGPSKVHVALEPLEIWCRIAFVDFSGLHDQRTIQQLLPLIKPRKVVFVGGEEAETMELADLIRESLNANADTANAVNVFTPTVGITVDASVDTNAWTVKLSQNMVRNLRWQNVRGMGVVAITGRLAAATLDASSSPTEQESPVKKKPRLDLPAVVVSSQNKSDGTPILDVVPANMATAVRSVAQPFHVGDLRLADLRKVINKTASMQAEFRGEGVLVVNGTVAVRKTATGQIEIDGGAYEDVDTRASDTNTLFYQVKRQIYQGLAMVTGV